MFFVPLKANPRSREFPVTIRGTLAPEPHHVKEFKASTTINAPTTRIWELLTDGPGYPSWNPTVKRVEGEIAPGKKVKVYPTINPDRAFPVKVTHFQVTRAMTWTGGMPLGLLKGVRTFDLERDPSGATRFTMHEVFSGPFLLLFGNSIPDMQPEFEKFVEALKVKAEAG